MRKVYYMLCILLFSISAFANTGEKIYDNIEYRSSEACSTQAACVLDLYLPEGVEDFPTIVWFHGGGLTGGHKFIPEQFKNSGMAIVAVEYRLLPDCKFTDCIDDAAAAVAWTFNEIESYGGDKSKIYVAGHSAGGYLTNMIGLDKKWLAKYKINADDIAGLFSVSGHAICHFSYRKQLGIKNTQCLVDEYAPLYHVRPDSSPIVLISGDRELEMLGRYEEQAYFWRMLKVSGHEHVHIHELSGFNHGEVVNPAYHIIKKYISNKYVL